MKINSRFLWKSLLALFWIGFAFEAGSANLAYRETLHLTWGKVEFLEHGTVVKENGWYTRTPPTFAVGGVFSPWEQSCLSNSFLTCTGRVGNTVVWMITSDTQDFRDAFQTRAGNDRCVVGGSMSGFPSLPEPWRRGAKSRDWVFTFRCQTQPPPPEPSLELALLVEDVPAGSAWKIPITQALADERVRRYAGLSPEQTAAVAGNAAWMHLFVAPRHLAAPPNFPTPVEQSDFTGFEVPIAFGVRALSEVAAVLNTDRHLTEANRKMLERRLAPDTADAFPGAYRWFPEPDASRKQFFHTYIERGGIDGLVRVAIPRQTGSDHLERVLPERNEWAIRVGPFRRALPPVARVGFVQGRTNNFPVEALPKLIKNPDILTNWWADIAKVDACLRDAVNDVPPGHGDFFWVPDLADAHARAVRNVERTRYVNGVQSSFRSNRFDYAATYMPIPVTGKIGASYNPEQGFGGSAEVNFTGWPRPGDEFSVKGTVAEEVVEGSLSYKLPYYRSLDRSTKFQLKLFGQTGRDDRFRLGGLSPVPFEHRHAAGGIEHEIFHEARGWDWTGRDTVSWDAHELSQANTTGATDDAGLLFRHRQTWRFTPPPPPDAKRSFEYTISPTIALAPEVGWDKSFWAGEVGGSARIAFGGPEHNEMHVTLRGSFGAASDHLPAPLSYRIGDADRLFGLEPGEYSGLSYVHGGLAYDLSLNYLLGDLFKSEDNSDPPPFLAGLALEVLAEIGTISADQKFQAATRPDHIVSSYGVALKKSEPELRGPSFRLGYAWSPDSVRCGGRVFTSLDWIF